MCEEFVFFLDATDEFLEERVLNLPESVVQGTSHSVEKYFPRLATFRENNSVDETVLKFFDELEIDPEHIGRPQRDSMTFELRFFQFYATFTFYRQLFPILFPVYCLRINF